MVSMQTSQDGNCTITAPRALHDVALEIFRDESARFAIFRLASCMSLDKLHKTERIAVNYSHDEAVAFARQHVIRKTV